MGIRWDMLSIYAYNSDLSNTLPCKMNNTMKLHVCVRFAKRKDGCVRACRVTALVLTLSHSQNWSSVSEQTHPALPATLPSRRLDEEAGCAVRQVCGLLKLTEAMAASLPCVTCHSAPTLGV